MRYVSTGPPQGSPSGRDAGRNSAATFGRNSAATFRGRNSAATFREGEAQGSETRLPPSQPSQTPENAGSRNSAATFSATFSGASGNSAATFGEALWRGLAPDGGLYRPATQPRLPPETWRRLETADLHLLAATLLAPFLGVEADDRELGEVVASALDFPLPLTRLDGGSGGGAAGPETGETWLLELFHGPTLAFKDVGARFLARWLPRHLPPEDAADEVSRGEDGGRLATVLVATSGDTGGAVAQAFHGVAGTRVAVLYPRGQVSPRQERQFATLGGNVRAFAVEGTFDDCQRLVKGAFADPDLDAGLGRGGALRLTSANSINIGRLLPQMIYYAAAWQRLSAAGDGAIEPVFVVPSGNFGNLCAGLYAAAAGLPVGRFVAATNANDVVPEYLATGILRPRPSVATLANAMDVGDPSNLARIRALFGDDLDALRQAVWGSAHDDGEIRRAIARAARETGTVLDPHTAVGWLALERYRRETGDRRPAVLLATAHPAKFAEVVEPVLPDGHAVDLPEALARNLDRPLLSEPLAVDGGAFARLLLDW